MIYDLYDLPLNEEGIRDFSWPLNNDVLDRTCMDAQAATIPLVRSWVEQRREGATEIMTCYLEFISYALQIYQGLLLAHLSPRGVSFRPEAQFGEWGRLRRGEAPSLPSCLDAWRAALPHKRLGERLRRAGAYFRRLWSRPVSTATGPAPVVFPSPDGPHIHTARHLRRLAVEGVITTKRSDIIRWHAACQSLPVGYTPHSYWFAPVSGRTPHRPEFYTCYAEELLQVLDGIFRHDGGFGIPEGCARNMAALLQQGASVVGCHLDRLRARKELLPRRLWTAAAGPIWDRLLRIAVYEAGGEVTGHDHAGGTKYMRHRELLPYEYFGTTYFVVYSERQAEVAVRNIGLADLFFNRPPEILALPHHPGHGTVLPLRRKAGERRTALVVLPPLLGDTQYTRAFPSDFVRVDYYARLAGQLLRWGYEVRIKPHPESCYPLPDGLRQFGAEIEYGRFDKALETVDVVVFAEGLHTTTFYETMRTNVPAVIMDARLVPWFDDVRADVQRRCGLVNVPLDGENRLAPDWDCLREQLALAEARADDRSFVSTYY